MLHDLSCTKNCKSYTPFHTCGEKNISHEGIFKGAQGLDLHSDFNIPSQISKHNWHSQVGWIHKAKLDLALQQLTSTKTLMFGFAALMYHRQRAVKVRLGPTKATTSRQTSTVEECWGEDS